MAALSGVTQSLKVNELTQADLNFHAGSQIQFHQRIYRLFSRLNDVEHALMGTDFVLIARVFVDVRRDQNGITLFTSRQRDRTAYLSARTLGSINNLLSRCIDQSMVERLQTDTDSLVLHYQTPSFMCKSSFPPEIRGRELYAAVQKVSTTILNGRKRPCWALGVKGSAHAVEWAKRETGDAGSWKHFIPLIKKPHHYWQGFLSLSAFRLQRLASSV